MGKFKMNDEEFIQNPNAHPSYVPKLTKTQEFLLEKGYSSITECVLDQLKQYKSGGFKHGEAYAANCVAAVFKSSEGFVDFRRVNPAGNLLTGPYGFGRLLFGNVPFGEDLEKDSKDDSKKPTICDCGPLSDYEQSILDSQERRLESRIGHRNKY
jgi:hypothetical protein